MTLLYFLTSWCNS